MKPLVRTTLALIAAWGLLAIAATPAEARVHHHHAATPAAPAAARHHRHHGAVAAPVTGHRGTGHHGRNRHGAPVAKQSTKGHHRHHARTPSIRRSQRRHAALCQTVIVRHHATQRCRG